MFSVYLISLFSCIFLSYAELWHKHYLTYSIENNTHLNLTYLNEKIREWQVPSLEIMRVEKEKGDIKIYFINFKSDHILGIAFFPPSGKIYINQQIEDIFVYRTIQHEFGHALGLKHTQNSLSIMYPLSLSPFPGIQESDKKILHDLYKCRYDSVTLINFYTYLKFRGRKYDRIDFDTGYTTNDTLWHPSIKKVNAMYRSHNSYVIISEKKFYNFNFRMKFINEGDVKKIFPGITRNIQAVLTFNNGNIIAFLEDKYVWYNNSQNYQHIFKVFPDSIIQGAFSTLNSIILISLDYMFLYDLKFNFIKKFRMCDKPLYKRVHCCNEHSNVS